MPRGNGTTYDHRGLKEVAIEYVEELPVGTVFDAIDFAKHLSTVPSRRFTRKQDRQKTSNHKTGWQLLSRSRGYFHQVLGQLDDVGRVREMCLGDSIIPRVCLYKSLSDGDLVCYSCSTRFTPRKSAPSRVVLNTCGRKCASEFLEAEAEQE